MPLIQSFWQLDVWKNAIDAGMEIFEESKAFPRDERFSMTDQVRRSSRSVATNIAEAWRKRRYRAAFISKLSDAEAEAAETQTWIVFALRCQYTTREKARSLGVQYERIIRQLVTMANNAGNWIVAEAEQPYGLQEQSEEVHFMEDESCEWESRQDEGQAQHE